MHKGSEEKNVYTSRRLAPSPHKKPGRFTYISKFKQYTLLFLMLALLILTSWQVFLYVKTMSNASLAKEDKTVSSRPTPPVIHYQRPNFEAATLFPQWSRNCYTTNGAQHLPHRQEQTGARWI